MVANAETSWPPERRTWLVGLALVAVTLALYWPVTTFSFVAYDDNLYVYENPTVAKGLSWGGLKWAATAIVGANWHPLTVLSHMLDCSVFGLFAGGHHLTNIVFHSINALLLFLLLKRATKLFWPGALVAALFAWHPLNVESSAWVAERKNVLSTFFLILTLWAYVRYAEKSTFRRYGLALGLFALGLMCKPMLVTLPLVLLLLDFWPLQRTSNPRRLFFEKIPFFILSIAASAATFLAQSLSHSVKSFDEVPLTLRLLNAPVACVTYLAKAVWPDNLCVFYPLPSALPVAEASGATLLLAAVTFLVFHWRFKFRWLLVGWLWFLITLVPVIGIIQTGNQALADRHAYVPLIGLFIAVAFSLNHWLQINPAARPWTVGVTAIFLLACLVLTRMQLAHWRDSIALFSRAVAVTENNFSMNDNLGIVLSNAKRPAEAIASYEAGLRAKPDDAELNYHLGIELMGVGKFSAAESRFQAALEKMPDNVLLINNLGVALAQQSKFDAAGGEFKAAIQIQPDYPKSFFNYGLTLEKTGANGPAITNFTAALKLDPDWPEALDALARLLATCPETKWRNPAEAVRLSARANEITRQEFPGYLETLALAFAAGGNFSNAVSTAEMAEQKARAGNLGALAEKIAAELKACQAGQIPQAPVTK